MERCDECGGPITMSEPSYYEPALTTHDFGRALHSRCGDPLGTRKMAARIAELEAALARYADPDMYVSRVALDPVIIDDGGHLARTTLPNWEDIDPAPMSAIRAADE